MMRKVDVAIIGAGTAGISARNEVSKHTSDYVVIDGGRLGTTCAQVGCMPSKVFIEIANSLHKAHALKKMGVKGCDKLTTNYPEIMSYVRKLRDRFVAGVKRGTEEWMATHLITSHATFTSANTLQVGKETIEAKKIIIATGSSPFVPDEWMHAKKFLIDTDSFFELETLPKKMAVIGTGVIGLELGQALARLGVEVVMIGKDHALGGLTDPEIANYAREKLMDEFPIITSGVEKLIVQDEGLKIETKDKSFVVDLALVAVGRKPNIKNLGLEKIGIHPKVNPRTFRVDGTSIYIAGDVSGIRPILHEAADEGRMAGHNAVRDKDDEFRRRQRLGIAFTAPQIALVGYSYKELTEKKMDFVEGKVSFEGQGRAIIMNEEKGLLKVYGDKKTGKLLGAELFAPEGEHLAHLLAWSIECELTVFEALQKPYYHPVIEEGLRTALRDLSKKVDTSLKELELMRCDDPPAGA